VIALQWWFAVKALLVYRSLCGAVWCSVVQCGAVWCSLQCGAVFSVMQCSVRCSVVQCDAQIVQRHDRFCYEDGLQGRLYCYRYMIYL